MLSLLLRPWIASCRETRDRMSDYLENELMPRERRRVMRHLRRCERCRAVLESLTRTLEHLRSLGAVDELAPSPATVQAVVERIEHGEQ